MSKLLPHFWKNQSISKKLYLVVGTMAMLIVFELLTLQFSMNNLSAVHSFVGGEGLWSKAQKTAAHQMHLPKRKLIILPS